MTKKATVRMFLLLLLVFATTVEAGTLDMEFVIAPPVYSISYDLQGGTESEPNPTSYTPESEDFKLKNPTKDGGYEYEFIGWEGTGINVNNLSMDVTIPKYSSGDREYTAHWKYRKTLKIMIVIKDFAQVTKAPEAIAGLEYTGSPQQLVTKGTASGGTIVYALGDTPAEYSTSIPTGTDEGTYRVWYKVLSDSSEYRDSLPASIDIAITLRQYNINYDLGGGGTNSENNPSKYTLKSGDVKLGHPTREHYEFEGWVLSGDKNFVASMDLTIPGETSGDLTYIAKWKAVEYSLSYELNGGTVSPDDNPVYYTIESGDFTLRNPTKLGYDFDGWTGTSVDVTMSKDVTIPQGSTGDRSYTANWAIIQYNLSYDLDGGTVSCDNPLSYTVDSEDIRLTKPTKLGYDFTGWSFDAEISLDVTIPKGSTGDREYFAT